MTASSSSGERARSMRNFALAGVLLVLVVLFLCHVDRAVGRHVAH